MIFRYAGISMTKWIGPLLLMFALVTPALAAGVFILF
jgi:hypothetical protein